MSAEVLPIEWPQRPAGDLKASVERTIAYLESENRLTPAHDATVALLRKLATAMDEASVGRGASIALLSAQYLTVVKELQALPAPVEADLVEYDVVLLPVVDDEG